jgi:DNA-binding response OmpR family regulator
MEVVRYRFGSFVLDAERYELTRAGERLEVRRKVFDVLRYLVEHHTRLVTKQELLDAVSCSASPRVRGSCIPTSQLMASEARRLRWRG